MRMPGMLMRFIDDIKRNGRESGLQFLLDALSHTGHVAH
jgi:hypothetical protein